MMAIFNLSDVYLTAYICTGDLPILFSVLTYGVLRRIPSRFTMCTFSVRQRHNIDGSAVEEDCRSFRHLSVTNAQQNELN